MSEPGEQVEERCPGCGNERDDPAPIHPVFDEGGGLADYEELCPDPFHDNPPPTQGQQERTMTRAEVEQCPDLAVSVLDALQARIEVLEAANERSIDLETALSDAESLAQRYREALERAADDLGKAANQFQSIKASQAAGHQPQIENNPSIFAEKERRARAALKENE